MIPRGAKMGPKGPNLGPKGPKRVPKSQKMKVQKKVKKKTDHIRTCIFRFGPFFEKKSFFLINFGGHFGDLFPLKMRIKNNTEKSIEKP